jgi:hypothetical protein
MRNIRLLGTRAVVFDLGAANAQATAQDPSAESSRYAILEPQTAAPNPMTEGDAAFAVTFALSTARGEAVQAQGSGP